MKSFRDILIGSPLPNAAALDEKLPIPIGLAVLSSDVLSSSAYATDELLSVLVLGGSAALIWSLPITVIIIALLTVLIISYRQLIRAYPTGGGSYTVAKENLGKTAGLIAASGLQIDYVLTVSVSIAAGVDAIISAFPHLASVRVEIGLVFLFILLIGNLRGVRESGRIFAIPTIFFVLMLSCLIITGIFKYAFGHPVAASTNSIPVNVTSSVGFFLLLRAFSSGCTALTGTEAISNSVMVFKEPEIDNARKTMLFMGLILGVLFIGITFLARVFGILPGADQTVISQIGHTVFGNNVFYYLVQFATLLILILAANTSFAGFPRVASMLGRDGYLPNQLSDVGSRLVFSNGIIVLGILAGALLVVFRGNVSALIPLYAVGVFISFTLAQAGMVLHWYRTRGTNWIRSTIINGTGAIFSAVALIVIVATKFTHGAWFILLLIPFSLYLFYRIHGHYENLAVKLSPQLPKAADISSASRKHRVIILVPDQPNIILPALSYARIISNDIQFAYIGNDHNTMAQTNVMRECAEIAPGIPLEILPASYWNFPASFSDYLRGIKDTTSNLTIILPEQEINGKWWNWFRRSRQINRLKRALLKERIPVVSMASRDNGKSSKRMNDLAKPVKHTIVMLVSGVQKGVVQAIQYARIISPDVQTVYIDCEGDDRVTNIRKQWSTQFPFIPLLIIPSPYRDLVGPVQEYIRSIKQTSDNLVTVVIPEMVTGKWWNRLLHRNHAAQLRNVLLYQEQVPVMSFAYVVTKRRIRIVFPYH